MDNGASSMILRFLWLTPTRALNWGYCMYVIGAKKYRGTIELEEALLAIEDYKRLRNETLTETERIFISGMREIAILYSNGIKRKNLVLDRELRAAEKEGRRHDKKSSGVKGMRLTVNSVLHYVPHGVFAALGVLIARIIGVVLPEELAAATGKTFPQFVAAVACAALWKYVSLIWQEREEARIDRHLDARVIKAIELHESGRDLEINKYWNDAAALWTAYTGKPIPDEWSSYRTIHKEEIRAGQIMRRKQRELEKSGLERFILQPYRKVMGKWRRNRRRRNGKQQATQ